MSSKFTEQKKPQICVTPEEGPWQGTLRRAPTPRCIASAACLACDNPSALIQQGYPKGQTRVAVELYFAEAQLPELDYTRLPPSVSASRRSALPLHKQSLNAILDNIVLLPMSPQNRQLFRMFRLHLRKPAEGSAGGSHAESAARSYHRRLLRQCQPPRKRNDSCELPLHRDRRQQRNDGPCKRTARLLVSSPHPTDARTRCKNSPWLNPPTMIRSAGIPASTSAVT